MVVGGLMLATLGACDRRSEGTAQSSPGSSLVTAQALSAGPLAAFQQACASCHGPHGALYGRELGRLSDAALAAKVREMIAVPARMSLPDRDVEALVAYHRSLVDGYPFICVTGFDGTTLKGEATPRSTVVVASGKLRQRVNLDDHGAWSFTYPPEVQRALPRLGIKIVAQSEQGLESLLDFGRAAFTHQPAAPPGGLP